MSIGAPLRWLPVGSESDKTGAYLAFGTWLREKRIAAKLASQPQAEIRARSLKLRLINQGKLSHIERGMNSNPDPQFLAQLATLYKLHYTDVVAEWVRVKFAIDEKSVLSRHAGTGASADSTRGADDAAAAQTRIQQLEADLEELRVYKAVVEEVRPLLSDALDAIDLTRGKGKQTGGIKAKGGGRH